MEITLETLQAQIDKLKKELADMPAFFGHRFTDALVSPNYSQGISGWKIDEHGNVEFNDGNFRGDITGASGTFTGSVTASSIDIGGNDSTSWHVDSAGNMWWGSAGSYAAATQRISSTGLIEFTNGTITGGTIIGTTITGGTVRTASSGARVQLNSSTNDLEIFDSGGKRISIGDNIIQFYASSGFGGVATAFISINGGGDQLTIDAGTGSIIALETASGGFVSVSDDLDVGNDLDVGGEFQYQNITQPVIYRGYVNANGSSGTPFPSGWSSSRTALGRYTITHPSFGSTGYTIQLQPLSGVSPTMSVLTRSSSSFTLDSFRSGPAVYVDTDFMFVVYQTP